MPNPYDTPPDDFSWHDSYIAPETDSVPDLINSTTDLVRDMLDEARDKSDDAVLEAKNAIAALQNAQLPEKLPDPPAPPSVITNFSGSIGLNIETAPDLGYITPQSVAEFNPDEVVIPDLLLELDDYVPVITGLTIPPAPVFVTPAEPTAPVIDTTVTIPTAPTASYGTMPELITLNMPTYVAPVLPVFNDAAPEFTDAAPDPFIQWTEPVYSSDIRDDVKAVILSMLAGGTGLPTDVERAIWERARGRLDMAAQKKIDEARSMFAARGHSFPPGMLNKMILGILDETNQNANEQSMLVAIEQAKLEQQNRQFAVQQGLAYEQIFVNLFLQVVDRNFQIAKFGVEVQIQVFNAKVAAFAARNTAFMAKIEKYKAELEGAFAYLRAFEALVKAEIAKGEFNQQQIAAYTAKVQAYNAQVQAYDSLIKAEAQRVEIEKVKIEAYRGEIDAYVAKINGQRAQFEAYSSRVQAEAAKAGLEEANARAYSAKVQGVAAKADVAIKQAEAQIQVNRLSLDYAVANMQRISQFTGYELAKIQANASVFEATVRKAMAKHEADRGMAAIELQAVIEANRNVIAKYTASLEAWKAQVAHILSIANLSAESMRAAGQIAGTLAAGAMAGTSVSAGVSGSAGASQAKQDSTARSRAFSQAVSDSATYNVSHTYNHDV